MRYTFEPIIIGKKKYRWLEPVVVTRSSRQRISFSSATATPANEELDVVWLAGNTGRWDWWEKQELPDEFKVFYEDFMIIPRRYYTYDQQQLLRQFVR